MYGRVYLTRRNGLFVDDFVDDRGDVLPREGFFPGDHFIEHDAERENIGAAVNGFSFDLLRRHVAGRAHNMRCLLDGAELENFGGAEVGDLDGIVRGEHEVGWLDVPMNDVALVGELERAASLLHDAENAGKRKRLMIVEMRLEALALDEFHGDVVEAVFFAGVVNHDDVGVGQKAGGAGFGLEALQKLGARKTGAFFTEADGLNGYGAANHRVFRFVHHAHGAAAEFADDFIPPGFGQSGHQRIRRRRGFRLSFY